MGFLVKEYDVPEIGKIRIIKSKKNSYEESFRGKYYLENSKNKMIYAGVESFEELENKALEIIQNNYRKIIEESEKKIIQENKKIGKLEICLEKLEMINDKKDWLRQYGTNSLIEIETQITNSKKIAG
jgi:hypothetical protein